MATWNIALAQQEDYQGIVSCLSTSMESLDELASWEEERVDALISSLQEDIESHRAYVLKQRHDVFGFLIVSRDIEGEFFPRSHSYSKTSDLLEELGHRGEDVFVIKALFVDAAHQSEGIGQELLRSLFARFKEASFLLYVEEGNKKGRDFFAHHGFFACGHEESLERGPKPKKIYGKRYRPTGLCREARW